VERLKANVDGIVLDVRDDGGGSLSTVVDIAGLL
jgi:carboxyl-terminal processing protease